MAIFEMQADQIVKIPETSFDREGLRERTDLQRLLRENIEVVAPDTLVLSEEFGDWDDSRRRIDLLGIDRQANLVVFELKRDETGGHMELQAIRYAAMVSTMTFEQAVRAGSTKLSCAVGFPMVPEGVAATPSIASQHPPVSWRWPPPWAYPRGLPAAGHA